ncbi:MAG: enoyl-CoA hydratase [Dehalococcoidia bacterium]|nr:enoyl-CoA hydratase [Dehalococcoidia bacterium]
MTYEQIIYDVDDGVATITLNRPERLNAFSEVMLREWADAIRVSQSRDDVRAVVVTGSGRGFCAGGDMKDASQGYGIVGRQPVAERRNSLRNSVHHVPRALLQLDKPYIGAINGAAVGAGMDMASMCDIRYASQAAKFAMSYVRVGLIPGDAGCYFLPRILGVSRALELIWTGETFDADRALEWGYVSRVCAPDALLDETREFALRLAKGPAVAMQLAKRLVYRSLEVDLNAALDLAQSAMIVAQSTEDAVEGPKAFTEKREPNFQGR